MVVLGSGKLSIIFPLKKILGAAKREQFLKTIRIHRDKKVFKHYNKHFVISSTVQRCCLSLL